MRKYINSLDDEILAGSVSQVYSVLECPDRSHNEIVELEPIVFNA